MITMTICYRGRTTKLYSEDGITWKTVNGKIVDPEDINGFTKAETLLGMLMILVVIGCAALFVWELIRDVINVF
jgi:hypothetical protein